MGTTITKHWTISVAITITKHWTISVAILFASIGLAGRGTASGLGAVGGSDAAVEDALQDEGKNAQPAEAKKEAPEGKEPDKKEPQKKDHFFAITGGTVYTVAGPVLSNVTILCKNGRIHEIGAAVRVPEGAEALDAAGYRVYPGLVAVNSSRVVGGDPPEDTTDVYSLDMALALSGGITSVLSGNAVAKTSFGTLEDHVVKSDVFINLTYSTSSPDARRKLRASLDKLRQHLREVEAHERAKKTNPDAKPPDDKWIKGEYQQHMKLLKGEAVAVISANTAHELTEICDLAETYGIHVVVRGAREGWTVAPQLARAGVDAIVTPRTREWRDERLLRPNGSSIENAAILHRHGVRLAIIPANASITTWGVAGRDLLHLAMEAAFGVRGGLPEDAALRAITLDAARILGVDHRVGSIEVGKDADFAIYDGDPLHYMSMARWTIVNGRIAYDRMKETFYEHIRPGGDLDAPPPSDYWPRRLGESP